MTDAPARATGAPSTNEGWDLVRKYFEIFQAARIGEISRRGHDFYVYAETRDAEGNYTGRVLDASGCWRPGTLNVKYEDSQATEPGSIQETPSERTGPDSSASRDYENTASDETAPTQDRIGALREWMTIDLPSASAFILYELCDSDLAEDWRDSLVFAAENAHFVAPDLQVQACSRLQELVRELRHGRKAGTEHVVWSAMRRFASLLPPEGTGSLLEFLDREGSVDTRMVALQCVVRVFEAAPPADTATVEALAGRVAELAAKFLDPDVFSGGENSGIARWAVVALAALGSRSLTDALKRVKSLDKSWFSSRVRQELQGLLDGWKDGGASDSNSTVRLAKESLQVIE